jgi:hypothetical protein
MEMCEVLVCSEMKMKWRVWEDQEKGSGGQKQLELVEKDLKCCEFFDMLKKDLEALLWHHIDVWFFQQGKNLDIENQDESTVILLTNFAAALDYRANKTICGSVDNHGILQIFYGLADTREVKVRKENDQNVVVEETIKIRDTYVFYVFGNSQEKGTKHDWIFHNAALEFICNYYLRRGREAVEAERRNSNYSNIRVYSDNCTGQYKCRMNMNSLGKIIDKFEELKLGEHIFAPVTSLRKTQLICTN